jgi:YfiH family protein
MDSGDESSKFGNINIPSMKDRVASPSVITIPRFESISFLRHGFGDGSWQENDFRKSEEWAGFRPLFLRQVHSDTVHFIDEMPRQRLRGDALVTRLPGLLLVIKSADCLSVLLVDERTHVIAAVHAGWKGIHLRVLEKSVRGMLQRYSTDPGSLLAAFGPCIGGGCYEVGEDVRGFYAGGGFPASLFSPIPSRHGKYLFDLRAAARLQLVGLGIRVENVFSVDICTHCDPAYPSYRRDKDDCGRMLSFIGIVPP